MRMPPFPAEFILAAQAALVEHKDKQARERCEGLGMLREGASRPALVSGEGWDKPSLCQQRHVIDPHRYLALAVRQEH